MLIATLPSPHNAELAEQMFAHPMVDGARYNVGMRTKYSPEEVLSGMQEMADRHGKRFWVDLKGRQLRITKWADPTYGDIELNHEIKVSLPASIYFRGDTERYELRDVDRNRLFVVPDPFHALGAGQAVNIIGKVEIIGPYFAGRDVEYIEAARNIGIHDYMLSFVERESDVSDLKSLDSQAKPVLKIESPMGMDFVRNEYDGKCQLMAARDDLSVNLGEDRAAIGKAVRTIIEKDPSAIAASRIFRSLDTGRLSEDDVADVGNLMSMGYRNFMLDDTISHRHFSDAMEAWKYFMPAQPNPCAPCEADSRTPFWKRWLR